MEMLKMAFRVYVRKADSQPPSADLFNWFNQARSAGNMPISEWGRRAFLLRVCEFVSSHLSHIALCTTKLCKDALPTTILTSCCRRRLIYPHRSSFVCSISAEICQYANIHQRQDLSQVIPLALVPAPCCRHLYVDRARHHSGKLCNIPQHRMRRTG